jgi:hypothetical protein
MARAGVRRGGGEGGHGVYKIYVLRANAILEKAGAYPMRARFATHQRFGFGCAVCEVERVVHHLGGKAARTELVHELVVSRVRVELLDVPVMYRRYAGISEINTTVCFNEGYSSRSCHTNFLVLKHQLGNCSHGGVSVTADPAGLQVVKRTHIVNQTGSLECSEEPQPKYNRVRICRGHPFRAPPLHTSSVPRRFVSAAASFGLP